MDNNDKGSSRSSARRLLHTFAEVLLSFIFAGGLCIVLVIEMCRNNHQCNDFGGVAFFVFSFFISIFAWGGLLSLFKKYRDRPQSRTRLDITVAVITVGLWAWYLISEM